MVQGRVDLHFHTECSGDAYMPLFAVVPMAERLGLRAIAKTDHDSLVGCDQLRQAAAGTSVEYIPAVELSAADENGGGWHILGYYIDDRHPALLRSCEREKAYGRLALHEQMRAWMAAGGPQVEDLTAFLREVTALRPDGEISLKQVCDCLVGRGVFATPEDAQTDCRTRTGDWQPPAHQPPSCREIIDLIHHAGGLAVIAHPKRAGLPAVQRFVAAGADGIECHNIKVQDAELQSFWRGFCAEQDLAYTGGTDWHKAVERWNVHTPTIADYDSVESLKQAYRKRFGRHP